MTEQFQHLTATEIHRVIHLLKKFKYLFGGILVMWNTTPEYLELKDKAEPMCSRPYPVPKVHKSMFRKKVEILVNLGFVEELNDSEWVAPPFAQPKAKTNSFRLLSGVGT